MAAPVTIDAFVQLMAQAELVPQDQLLLYVQQLGSSGLLRTPSELARRMVQDGVLTQFQAEQLLSGKFRGFRLGKYLILERIGAGGMGTVFLAAHRSLQRRVALKVLPPHSSAATPAILERFYREARAAALLDHGNIARAYDADSAGNLHFLVMEFIDGLDLQQLVAKQGRLEPGHAAQYIRQAAMGLAHAHERKLIHRDIKPSNLMLNRQGQVKILDMGLARFFQDESDTLTVDMNADSVLGTADYIAPEQALHSHSVDIRADIYSLGGTLFYLLTGRPPFTGGGAAQKLLWHQVRPVEDVRALQPSVPAGLAVVLARMMAKDPTQRFQTPSEVSTALEPYAATELPVPTGAELPRWSRAALNGGGSVPAEALVFTETVPVAASPQQPRPSPLAAASLRDYASAVPPTVPVAQPTEEEEEETGLEDFTTRPVGSGTILAGIIALVVIGVSIWWFTSESAPPAVAKTTLLEGEHMTLLNKNSNFSLSMQQMSGFAGSKWSGNSQLWASCRGPGDWADLRLFVEVAGKYRVNVCMTRATDYGTVEFAIDGKPVGKRFDGYIAAKVINSDPIDLGVVELRKGVTPLRITMVGTNENSTGTRYMWGLDRVVLEPVPEESK